MSRGCIKKLIVETIAYVFTDISFLDSYSPYFLKKLLKVAQELRLKIIPNYGRIETQSWP